MQQYQVLRPLEHDQEDYGIGRVVDHDVFGDETAAYLISTGTLKPLQDLAELPDGATPESAVFEPPHTEPTPNPSQEGSKQSTEKGGASQDAAPSPLAFFNTAEKAALVKLPHIGEAKADKLIAGRPHATLDAARQAAGLSEAKWAELLPQLSL